MKPSPLTKTLDLGTIKSFAVFSDLHLRNPKEPNALLAEQIIPKLTRVELVVFLGDVFDFIFASSVFFQKRWAGFIQACKHLQAQGTQIAFIEGNHDFGFEHNFPKKLESAFALHGDCSLRFTHPKLGIVMLRHGDDIVCPDDYLRFRRTVKNKYFQKAASLIPGTVMHHIFSRWAKISRSQDVYRHLSPNFFEKCVTERTRQFPVKPNVIIMGHVHENIDTNLQNTRYITGPSWLESPNILVCDTTGNFQREFPTGKDVPLFLIPRPE